MPQSANPAGGLAFLRLHILELTSQLSRGALQLVDGLAHDAELVAGENGGHHGRPTRKMAMGMIRVMSRFLQRGGG